MTLQSYPPLPLKWFNHSVLDETLLLEGLLTETLLCRLRFPALAFIFLSLSIEISSSELTTVTVTFPCRLRGLLALEVSSSLELIITTSGEPYLKEANEKCN